ncbi:ribonuclease HII [Mariniflexile aquimaris]|uniref:Ribonuclease HII n=1 Tax=Mariniflexile aquimaris TaxID=881009 RepID=A0ABW3BWZ8_9FLAO
MRFIYFSLLLLLAVSCSKYSSNRENLIDFVPDNASIIIKSSNLENLRSSIKNSDFLDKFSKTNAYLGLESKLENLSLLKPSGEVLICFSTDTKDSLHYSIITKYHANLFKTDSLKNYIEESITYEKQTLTKSTFNNNTFYSSVIDSTFLVSSSKEIIQSINTKPIVNPELVKIYNATSNDKTFSIIIKANTPFIKSFFIPEALSLKSLTQYLAIDVDVNQDEIYMNGITKASDSSKHIIQLFKNTIPQENQTQNLTPQNSDGFMSFTFKNFKTIEANFKLFNKTDSIANTLAIFDNIIEVGVIYEDDKRAIILNSTDLIATEDALISEQNIINTVRGVDIYSFSQPDLFANTFSPLIKFKSATKYCVLDNFFVFANNTELLQSIISNYQNKTTLSETEPFKNCKAKLSDASSLLMVTNPSSLKSIINRSFKNELDANFDNYSVSALQFIYDSNFAHVNGIIKKSKSAVLTNSISEELNIKLANDILTDPQFVINHITKEKEIVVQDVKNNLYLISSKGKILWKKQLQGPVLGSIEQIDIFRNGRLQLAFATPNKVYVIDRNGKDVAPFPGNFNDDITQPLAVFDYDKNKDYRLFVTQGKHILVYDKNTKLVNGFNFSAADDAIICQPKHFRISSRDYIVFKSQNKFYILDRTGNTRVTPKTKNTYSNQPIYLYNNAFTTTSLNGDVVTISTNGKVSTQNLNLSEKHSFFASSKSLIAHSDNKLLIKNTAVELDFGNYTRPELFYIKDKIYVSITDMQTQKVYLFDSQGTLLTGFPVYGTSAIAFDNIDKDSNLEFVTKGEHNSILLYQLN